MRLRLVMFFIMTVIYVNPAYAHPGRTAADGCHYCRTNCEVWDVPYDERHCHDDHPAPQACTPPPAGLLSWWPGDTDANDISGNAHQAELQNGAQAGTPGGQVDGAFSFDGLDDGAQTSLILPVQGTIELWVQAASLSGVHGVLGTFGQGNGTDRLWLVAEGASGGFVPNTLRVNLGNRFVDDISIPLPDSLQAGEWTHLAVTFDYVNNQHGLYVNGLLAAPPVQTPGLTPTQPLRFGGVPSNFGQQFFFHGLLDEITVYDRVLDESEIQGIFDAGSAGKCLDVGEQGCYSRVTTLAGLMTEVEALATSLNTRNALMRTLDNAQHELDDGNHTTARTHLTRFITAVVNRSHRPTTNRHRLVLDEANHLICSASNVLVGISIP